MNELCQPAPQAPQTAKERRDMVARHKDLAAELFFLAISRCEKLGVTPVVKVGNVSSPINPGCITFRHENES